MVYGDSDRPEAMTERDDLATVRELLDLVQDAHATMHRLQSLECLNLTGTAIVIAWMERASAALEEIGAKL